MQFTTQLIIFYLSILGQQAAYYHREADRLRLSFSL